MRGKRTLSDRISMAAAAAGIVAGIVIFSCGKRPVRVAQRVSELRSRVLPVQGVDPYGRFITMGSGALVELPQGYTALVTNHHVCEGILSYFPFMTTQYAGRPAGRLAVIRTDKKSDLCLLVGVTLLNKPGFKIKNYSSYRVGEDLLVLGYPRGGPLTPQTGYYIQQGEMMIVGPLRQGEPCDGQIIGDMFGLYCGERQLLNAMTTLIYPGNSGSPVFNSEGEFVGVANSYDNFTHQGNFISGSTVTEFLKGLEK